MTRIKLKGEDAEVEMTGEEFEKVKDLLEKDFGNPPYVIIVPGKLHFTEKEYLEFHGLKR